MSSDHQSSEQYCNFFQEPQIEMNWVSLSRSFSTDEICGKNFLFGNDAPEQVIEPDHGNQLQCMENTSQDDANLESSVKKPRKRKAIKKQGPGMTCKCTKNECNNNYCSCKRVNNKCSSECSCRGCTNNTFVKRIICKIEDFSFFSFDFCNKETCNLKNF